MNNARELIDSLVPDRLWIAAPKNKTAVDAS